MDYQKLILELILRHYPDQIDNGNVNINKICDNLLNTQVGNIVLEAVYRKLLKKIRESKTI